MPIAKSTMAESIHAGVGKTAQEVESGGFGGVFKVTCFDADGRLKWEDKFHNLVVNQGLQYLNDVFFKSLSTTYTAAWYLGLVDATGTPTYAAGNTLASHGSWTEIAGTGFGGTVYTGNRKQANFGTPTTANPSVIDNSGSVAVFSIAASATIAGAFLTNQPSSNTGILFSAGNFTGGSKTVANGDTVNVTYTFSATAT
jgi:hypothetical protein